jgi:hypothetical protein
VSYGTSYGTNLYDTLLTACTLPNPYEQTIHGHVVDHNCSEIESWYPRVELSSAWLLLFPNLYQLITLYAKCVAPQPLPRLSQ